MLILLLSVGCGEKSSEDTAVESFDVLAEFESHLTGSFNSNAQSLEQPQYYDVSLKACPVGVSGIEGTTLYVEQALSEQMNSPYRQRVYVLSQVDQETVRSEIYELNNERAMIGQCDKDAVKDLTVEDLVLKDGCAVTLTWNGEGFEGQTDVGTCLSTMNGATYATSVVQTTTDSIASWDQGWDANGNQVWGATDGPYIFVRQ